MTWGEFKKIVEAAGIKDSDDIWYIDVSHPVEERMSVNLDYQVGLAVSS